MSFTSHNRSRPGRARPDRAIFLALGISLSLAAGAEEADSENCRAAEDSQGLYCPQTEQITIFGSASDVKDVAGGATLLSEEDLTKFEATDVVRAMRSVPCQLSGGRRLRLAAQYLNSEEPPQSAAAG